MLPEGRVASTGATTRLSGFVVANVSHGLWLVSVMEAGLSPVHRAFTTSVPGTSVARTDTRLMPHSRSRQVLLIEFVLPLL